MMMTILCNLSINTLILSQFSHAMNDQTPHTRFYLGFIVWGRSPKRLKVTSFLGGAGACPLLKFFEMKFICAEMQSGAFETQL